MTPEPALPARDPSIDAPHPPAGAPPETETAPLPPGRRLLRGRWSWLDVLIIGPVLGVSAWYYAGYPLGTWLVLHDQAVTAELLRGSIPAMILSGAQVRASGLSPWVALLAPLPITWCTDPCFFFGGRRYGRALMEFLGRSDPRWNRRLARGERIYARWAGWAVFLAPVVFFPGSVFYFLAGETRRMPFWQFILLDGAGELAFIAEVVALGFIVGKPAENVVNALSNYSLPIIVGTVVLVIVISVLGSRRGAGMRPGSSG